VKASRVAVLFTIAILATSTSVISVSAAGRTAASIPNTILNGKGAPLASLGINGDFYIDTRSLLIYGPKAKGKWLVPQNLQGPIGATGVTGSDGKNGSDAKIGTSNTSLVGSVGAQGERGLTGAAGPAGPAGATGAAGSSGSGGGTPGATGAVGATGAPGTSGAPGSTGPAGPTGSTGATGLTGANGAAGAQGDAGSAGTSEVKVISISNFTINTSTPLGVASSSPFGTLATNSSYFFQIYLIGEAATTYFDFAATVSSTGETPIFNFAASRSKLVTLPGKNIVYGVTLTGTIKTLGTASTLAVNLIDITGETSADSGVTFSGRAYLQKVGTIS
jgi:hypothetical protein